MPRSTDSPADKIRGRLTAELADIRSRKDLSEDGRRRQLARVRTRAEKEMRELARAEETTRETRRRELIKQLFENPTAYDTSSTISYRDARTRAANLKKPDEAAQLLAEATMAGDRPLARAAAMRALDGAMGDPTRSDQWAAVVNEWAKSQPASVDEALTELSELQNQARGTSRVTASMQYSLPPVPELAGHNTTRLAEEADQNPGEAERDTSTGFETPRRRKSREEIFGTQFTPQAS